MSGRLASGATDQKSADFLLELRSEEIPARMQAGARNDLARLFAEELERAGLSCDGIETFSTPRRLALIARRLPLETQPRREELKGPRAAAPPQAIEGFLRKARLSRDQLEEREGVLFAVLDTPGQPTRELLGPIVERIIRAFPWPKSMRWGEASISTGSLRWVRPLHGIVAMLGDDIVPVEIDGTRSGATTLGHRFHHPGAITIGGPADYAEKLRACHVIVDQDERERIIRDGAAKLAADAGLALVEDEGLVAENAGLTEWPVPLLGRFDPEFLDVPREVIVLTMRTNQKYFACTSEDRGLSPAFVCVANIAAKDGGAAIVEGNRRVLAARLADARFFWEQDLKVPLEEQAKKLSGIVFHERLGTVADKVERVAKLARWLVEEGIVKGADPDQAERAARLAKADLVTGMVGEFPELQGVIGGYLARAQGEPAAVADAIRDHYKPVGQGDEVPTAPVTMAVALADKLDTILEFYGSHNRPSGSKDPFAVRRAALGAIELILANNLRICLRHLGHWFFWWQVKTWNRLPGQRAYGWGREFEDEAELENGEKFMLVERSFTDIELHEDNLDDLNDIEFVTAHRVDYHDDGDSAAVEEIEGGRAFVIPDWRVLRDEIVPFFADRLKVQQREAGVRHDLIDAVFALGNEDDLVRLLARVNALQHFIETAEGADLLTAYKRAAKILKKEKWEAPSVMSSPAEQGVPQTGEEDPLVLVEEPGLREAIAELTHESSGEQAKDLAPEEAVLIAALDAAEPKASAAVEAEDFTGAMEALASLRRPIDSFFDHVTVNDPDPAKRSRRLNLLARFRDAVHRVADFSRIEG